MSTITLCLFSFQLFGCSGGGGGNGAASNGIPASTNQPSATPPVSTSAAAVNVVIEHLTGQGLVLTDGTDTESIPGNASGYTFPTRLTSGASYEVRIVSQPGGFSDVCAVSNGKGTAGNSDISDIKITCRPATAMVTTVAGNGSTGSADGQGSSASFYYPFGIAVDQTGNIYIADYGSQSIRKIDTAGSVTTFSGTGSAGSTNGTGTAASFNKPFGVALDNANDVIVADSGNHLIRKITPSGTVTTFAGSGIGGSADGTGTSASFHYPGSVAVDKDGNVYVADTANCLIRKISPAGVVTTLAGSGSPGSANGTGTAASFYNPYGVAVDSGGNVYVADIVNNLIRKISPAGVVTTLAGSGNKGNADGIGSAASFNIPFSVAVDNQSNVYVADYGNQVIRKITSEGIVSTLAGSGLKGNLDGAGTSASFNSPEGIAVDSSGNLYVTDTGNHLIRKITVE